MDNKFHNMLDNFFADVDLNDKKELDKKLQEFVKKYNSHEIEYENTILDDAYDLLEKAENAKSKVQAKKYAEQAYNMCPECFAALLFLVDLEYNPLKRWKLLDEGLEKEKARLEKEHFFDKDCIGEFYAIFETRPYIRGLLCKVQFLIVDGKLRQACDFCKEILRLNKNDNLGARYLLMALYSILEEENKMLKLYKKYPEESLKMLFPLLVLYYKQGNDKKAKEYIDRINKSNPNFIKFFEGKFKEDKSILKGYYSKGEPSEVIMYFMDYLFLLDTVPTINYYIIENSEN